MPTTETTQESTTKSLVDEKPPETLEAALKALADSKEEVQRSAKHNERLVNALKTKDQQVDQLNEKLKVAKKTIIETPGSVSENRAEDASYTGPSQKEIYLSIVQGMMGAIDPSKLSEKVVQDMSASVLGMSEVFFHKASRRVSFGAKK